ncbi:MULTISPECIES: hypothetical protein [unclassified Mycolicibacterium]|uniref:Uncharacterized protein n=1 Tax=Mycolicibacterium sp. CBMA 213 TaxID=1968788 RepID=A0A1S6GKM5_9MYCO|nr:MULTISPECIES: hypothetical protein [unclassified Mycolicibacterium]AQS22417.1 hypothetical protein pCBMA213_2_00053 [Mycolicibacterium sp. CBMA 213]
MDFTKAVTELGKIVYTSIDHLCTVISMNTAAVDSLADEVKHLRLSQS